jgi:hypothetical protein
MWWADTAFPDQDPHGIPRLDLRELDVRSRRKILVMSSAGSAAEPRLVGQRAERDALRVPEVHHDELHGFTRGGHGYLAEISRQPHRRAETSDATLHARSEPAA